MNAAINKGDILTFGDDPTRWIADEVYVNESGISAYHIRPLTAVEIDAVVREVYGNQE